MKPIFSNKKGISVIEILIVISIIAILSALIIPRLSDFKKEQLIKNTVEDVSSLLNKAKLDSNSSLDSSNYSIYFETDKITYFKGTSFNINDLSNQSIVFSDGIKIKESGGIDLNGGGNILTFPRLTGEVIGYGTIVLELIDGSKQKTININKLGSISIQ
jgi:type II secretory pathway pseudopilin PulG